MPAINNPLCRIGSINRGHGPHLQPKQSNFVILKTLHQLILTVLKTKKPTGKPSSLPVFCLKK